MEQKDEKRLFFGYEVASPWPSDYPLGDVIDPASRHMTSVFLGNTSFSELQKKLADFPRPSFQVGPVGAFDECLFLPERHPRVVAWHLQNYELLEDFNSYQAEITRWLKSHGYPIDERPFLSHVSIARRPSNCKQWEKAFVPLPVMILGIHLYESTGHLNYQPIWSFPFLSAFEEKDHTADIAFQIRAESIASLHLHAQMALAFKHPLLLKYIQKIPLEGNLDNIIMSLNRLISQADSEAGCPLKAVSFHGKIAESKGIYQWEMIVDV